MDLVPLYPSNLRFQFTMDLRQWYIETYHDRFFVYPPPWFKAFMWMEALYHMPLSIWVIPAILRGRFVHSLFDVGGCGCGYVMKHADHDVADQGMLCR